MSVHGGTAVVQRTSLQWLRLTDAVEKVADDLDEPFHLAF
jgi:hypothetical protein